MSYGGLRGAVAFALVLVVDEEVGIHFVGTLCFLNSFVTFCRINLHVSATGGIGEDRMKCSIYSIAFRLRQSRPYLAEIRSANLFHMSKSLRQFRSCSKF